MIYLDNSATTNIKPKEVIKAMSSAFTKFTANPGRSGHKLAIDTSMQVEQIRQDIAEYLNAQNVVFTAGCTDALNLALLGTMKEGGHIVISSNDHNASARPIFEMHKKYGTEVSVATPKSPEILTLDDILPHIKKNTYLVCVNHMSNVDGAIADIKSIGEYCAENNILFCVDGAQSAGHLDLDMHKNYIDLLALAPHKGLYSPQGVGVLCFSKRSKLKPIRFGGTGTESESVYQPTSGIESFESGTLATPNILGLGAGLQFVKQNFEKINSKIDDLGTYLNYELSNTSGVKVYTHPNNSFGIIAFNIRDYGSTEVSQMLSDRYQICTRGGLHCAALKHQALNTTMQGIVRASLGYFNTFSDCTKLVKSVKEIARHN